VAAAAQAVFLFTPRRVGGGCWICVGVRVRRSCHSARMLGFVPGSSRAHCEMGLGLCFGGRGTKGGFVRSSPGRGGFGCGFLDDGRNASWLVSIPLA
jgi:hypothetical protein